LAVLAAVAAGAVLTMAPPASAATATTTTLVSSANPSTAGQSVTLTSTVTGDTPTGTVDFADSGVLLGSAALNSEGAATLVVGSLTVGGHALTATYQPGDLNNDTSQGTLTQTVVAAPAPPPPPPPPATPVVTVKPPKVKLAVSTTKASVGDKVRLSWHSKHADVVMASGDWAGTQKSKGSKTVRIAERGEHVFKLTVKNASGAKTATVKVLAARKAKTLELVVTEELTMVGSEVDVTADGLAKGEDYTVRLDGKPIMTGKANKKGDVARTFTLAKTTAEGALALTITGSNPGRVGTAVLTVIKPKKLVVEVDQPKVEKKSEITLTVTGLLADEPLTVMYLGKKLTVAKADEAGEFTYTFNVGKDKGKHTVKVIGADPSRAGEVEFTVTTDGGGPGEDL
jgi:plastocyanin